MTNEVDLIEKEVVRLLLLQSQGYEVKLEDVLIFINDMRKQKEPNFKVGDTIRYVDGDVRTVVEVREDCYKLDDCSILHFNTQDKWELVEEYNITGIKSRHATGKLKDCIDNQTKEGLDKARKQLEGNPQECMYTKDHYTDNDRKTLCEGCMEDCRLDDWLQELHNKLDSLSKEDFEKVWAKYHQKEEPVSEDLEEISDKYSKEIDSVYVNDMFDRGDISKAVKFGANWKKLQMMKDAITGQLENGEDYLRIKCLYTSCRPQDDGKLVKFIIIKED